MIEITTQGSFKNIEGFLRRAKNASVEARLAAYGREGVQALASATPVDSGETAASWSYRVERSGSGFTLSWTNSHMGGSTPVAILIQYGHGNGSGGYVAGRDFINPAIRPIFDRIANDIWKEAIR